MSSGDQTLGESLNKEAPYHGEEKKYVTSAMEAELETEFDEEKSSRENLYSENVKDGVDVITYYMPVIDQNKKPVAVLAETSTTSS